MALTIKSQGYAAGTVDEVDTTFRARRVLPCPFDVAEQGAYSLAMDNGTTVFPAGALTGAEHFHFRWTSEALACAVRGVRVSAGTVIGFAAGRLGFELYVARGWTADGTGGTTAVMAGTTAAGGGTARKRSSFAQSRLGTARIAQTGNLGAGTKTTDTTAVGKIWTGAPTGIGPFLTGEYLWKRDTPDEYPATLGYQDGLVVLVTAPATGTWYFGYQIEWTEKERF